MSTREKVDAKQAATPAAATPDNAAAAPDRKRGLKGLSFGDAEALLSPREVDAATAYNQSNFQDPAVVAKILSHFGLAGAGLERDAALAVAGFQGERALDPDGKLGPRTWRLLKPEVKPPAPTAPAATTPAAKPKVADKAATTETKNDSGAEAAAPAKVDLPAVSVTQAAAQAPAGGGPLKQSQLVEAMNDYRKHPVDPVWVARFQAAIGAPVVGVPTEATLQIYAQKQIADGMAKPNVMFWTRNGKAIAAKYSPDLPVTEQKLEAKDGKQANAEVGVSDAEEYAVQKVENKTLAQYVGSFQTIQFLGKSVTGHPHFIERLRHAQAFLALHFPKMDDKQIGKTLGVTSVSHYRPSTKSSPQAFHGVGFALDINPSNNPWVLGDVGKSDENKKETADIIARAARFMGKGEAVTVPVLKQLGGKETTEGAFDRLEASNQALRDYRAMSKDRALMEKHFQRDDIPADIKAQGVDHWFKQAQYDHLAFAKRNWKKGNSEDGFMDLQKLTVQAMRDAAGLAWGAIDMGGESGDMMHFDGRTLDRAASIKREKGNAPKS